MAADVSITRPERDVDYLALTGEARGCGNARFDGGKSVVDYLALTGEARGCG